MIKYFNLGVKICVTLVFLALVASTAIACGYSKTKAVGEYGGHTFYRGLMIQIDPISGKRLTANQAVTVRNIAECVKVCLENSGCSGVSYRPTYSGQCLTFAGFDFETNHNMDLVIAYSPEISVISARIRKAFQGATCR